MRQIYFLILLSFLSLTCSKSPEELQKDSDRFYNRALEYYERGYLNQSLELFEKVIKIENKLNNLHRKANCFIYLGLIYYQISDFNKSLNYYNQSLQILRSIKDKKNELLVMNNVAGIYANLGQYDEAIKIYSEIIGSSLIFADKESEAIASVNLGEVYQEIWDFDKSFEYFNKAFESYQILGELKGKIYTLNKIGELLISSKNFSAALKTFDMAFEILNKTGTKYLIQEIYNNIGVIYFYENQISRAKEIFEIALNSIQPSESNQQILISIKNNLGDCEFKNQSFSKALEYYTEALSLSESSFLKFLSPILQLKIAKCYEQLYFIYDDLKDKNQAKRFFQYAISRFEENSDLKNLQKALTIVASFYFRTGEFKKTLEFFSKLESLNTQIKLKPDDHLRYFVIKPEYDFGFIKALIEHGKSFEALKFIETIKFQQSIEFFLRFRDFKFLREGLSDKFQLLKRFILEKDTYEMLLIQEISLPSAQRIKEKIKIARKEINDASEKINDLFESLTNDFLFLKFIAQDKSTPKFVSDQNVIYVEILPTSEYLIFFFISNKGISSKSIKINNHNLSFNLKIFRANLNEFKQHELKEFSSQNFGEIADKLISEVNKIDTDVGEIIFLINGTEFDFITHLFYSKKYKQFIVERFNISYSYFINEKKNNTQIKSIGVLGGGKVNQAEYLKNIKSPKSENYSINTDKMTTQRKIKIGLSEEKNQKINNQITHDNINLDCIISLDELFINESSPELIFYDLKSNQNNSRFYLRQLLSFQPKLLILKSIQSEDIIRLIHMLSLFSFSNTSNVILPMIKQTQDFTSNFLYNYIKRVENKNLNTATREFFNMINNTTIENANRHFYWIKFKN